MAVSHHSTGFLYKSDMMNLYLKSINEKHDDGLVVHLKKNVGSITKYRALVYTNIEQVSQEKQLIFPPGANLKVEKMQVYNDIKSLLFQTTEEFWVDCSQTTFKRSARGSIRNKKTKESPSLVVEDSGVLDDNEVIEVTEENQFGICPQINQEIEDLDSIVSEIKSFVAGSRNKSDLNFVKDINETLRQKLAEFKRLEQENNISSQVSTLSLISQTSSDYEPEIKKQKEVEQSENPNDLFMVRENTKCGRNLVSLKLQEVIMLLMVEGNLSSYQAHSVFNLFQNAFGIFSSEAFKLLPTARNMRKQTLNCIALHHYFVRQFCKDSESLMLAHDGVSKKNLAHATGVIMVDQRGRTCAISIFKTSAEDSETVADAIYAHLKSIIDDGSNAWIEFCSKTDGFMSDNARTAQKINDLLSDMFDKVFPKRRPSLPCFMHFTLNAEKKLFKAVQQKNITIQRKIPHIFGCHTLHGIKKSLSTEFRDWCKKHKCEILCYGKSKKSIYFKIEIGSRFHAMCENSAVLCLHYSNILNFLEEMHSGEYRSLILSMRTAKLSVLVEIGSMSLAFRCLVCPLWTVLAEKCTQKELKSALDDFREVTDKIMLSPCPLKDLLNNARIDDETNIYYLLALEIEMHLNDDYTTKLKDILKRGVTECLSYLQSIVVEQSTDSEEEDYVMTTNCGIERLFGCLKQAELTKFNMNPSTLSAFQCLKNNHALEELTQKENWEAILTMAINQRGKVIANIDQEKSVLEEKRLEKMEVHLLEEKQRNNKIEEEKYLLCMNPGMIPSNIEELGDCYVEWKKMERSWISHRNQLSKSFFVKVLTEYFFTSIQNVDAITDVSMDRLEGEKLLKKLIKISVTDEL